MKKSRSTEEQIAYVLRQAEAETPVQDVWRGLGISKATFYVWKKKYASLGVSELRKLRQLEAENARLKRLVADLTLDKHLLPEVIAKKSSEAVTPQGNHSLDPRAIPGQFRQGVSAGIDQPRGMVSAKHGEGSVGLANAHPGDCDEPAEIWIPTDPCSASSRGLEGQPEASPPAIPFGRAASANAGSKEQAPESASGAGTTGNGSQRTLEHGLRARSAQRQAGVPDPDGRG